MLVDITSMKKINRKHEEIQKYITETRYVFASIYRAIIFYYLLDDMKTRKK